MLLPAVLSCVVTDAGHLNAQLMAGGTEVDTSTLVGGLDTPWEILWGSDGMIWVTERYGRVSRVDPETGAVEEILNIAEVHEQSEAGLLGMVHDPAFSSNGFLYLAYNYLAVDQIREKLVRYTFSGGKLADPFVLIENIGGSGNHNGSRLAFGPEGKIYMSTGDMTNSSNAQDTLSLNGKILRFNPDGTVPDDNPFPGSYIWSYGHRNPQGMVFTPSGRLFSSEHGPANDDELNLIRKKGNYGWPDVEGYCNLPGEQSFCEANNVVEPLAAWTPTLAVSGVDYYSSDRIPDWQNSILMCSLKAGRFTVLKLAEDTASVSDLSYYFSGYWGRLRDVCVSPDGRIFIATSNRDGRGSPARNDDRIMQISRSTGTGLFYGGNGGQNETRIFPNPMEGDQLSIRRTRKGQFTVSVLDASGKKLHEERSGDNSVQIPFNWARGVYFIRVESGRSTEVLKLIRL